MEVLSVTRDVDGTAGLVQLPISNIAYMAYIKKINRVTVHTVDDEFFLMGTLVFWQNALVANGYRFISVDRTNVVNIDRIKYLDKTKHNAYFESAPSKTSKRCTMTNIKFDQIADMIQMNYISHLPV
ncbi:LytTR family transcriptional regulator DNA-binding domain-containing protein [Paenibacillus tritici]|uniref:LytTR family transcriptional regulator DNA-binding domain-containing protein n=1 Tax=Paenibacillus tritici TaxID=1873425 RepID=A0ABX2DJE7_9BACL|nr:LytTR family transcriptional regulator DNA-binding domain-containing protein [Paenibacillus tritici]NQX43784.1 LytTR family transcriptional regulator DNA-binding domain-containing protein [Paenibacillus tritici]